MSAPTLSLKPIRQLPLQLANQIAAGEVVERPASVVKELLENSLDAGATRIDVAIQHGGLREIVVRDDGAGIPAEQLGLAVSRHATSKIDHSDDLANIQSLGFRGEALASIASVSRLQLTACTEQDKQAWLVRCEQGQPLAPEVAAHPPGTSVQVQELFYNTPARRKFLRNERTEFRHIDTVVRRVALSHFDVGIKLSHNGRNVFQLGPASTPIEQQRRVSKLCGKAFMDHAVVLDFQTHGLRLQGWLTRTEFSRSSNDLQHFFVNGRMIRDRLITHAIHQVYQDELPAGRYPGFVLHLTLDPHQVDVNVHPTKHEVRFREARLVHDFIYRCCRDALQQGHESMPADAGTERDTTDYPGSKKNQHTVLNTGEARLDWTRLAPVTKLVTESASPVTDAADQFLAGSLPKPLSDQPPLGQAIGLLHDRFLLAQTQHGLVMVDLQRVEAQRCYQYLQDVWQTGESIAQPLLVPVSVAVSLKQADMAERLSHLLARLGFELDRIGPEAIMVRMLPSRLRNRKPDELIPALLQQLTAVKSDEPAPDELKSLLRFVSQQVQTDFSQQSMSQLNQVLRQVEALADPTLWCELDLQQIQSLINPVQND